MSIQSLSQLLDVPFDNNLAPTPVATIVCDTENNPSVKDVLVESLQSFGGQNELADRLKKAIADAKEDKDPAMAIMFDAASLDFVAAALAAETNGTEAPTVDVLGLPNQKVQNSSASGCLMSRDAPTWHKSATIGAFCSDIPLMDLVKSNNSGSSGSFGTPNNLSDPVKNLTQQTRDESNYSMIAQIRKATDVEYHARCPETLDDGEYDHTLVYKYLEFDIMHNEDRWFEIFKSKLCVPHQLKDAFIVFADNDLADVTGYSFGTNTVNIDPSPVMKELSREKTLKFVGFFLCRHPAEKDEELADKLHFEVMRQLNKPQSNTEELETKFGDIYGNMKEAVHTASKDIAAKVNKPKSSAAKRADAKKRNMAKFKNSMAYQLVNSFKPK